MTNDNNVYNADLDEIYELFKKEFERSQSCNPIEVQSLHLHVRMIRHCIENVIQDTAEWLWDKNLDFDELQLQIDDVFGEDNWDHMAIDGTETNTDLFDHYIRSIGHLTVKEVFKV